MIHKLEIKKEIYKYIPISYLKVLKTFGNVHKYGRKMIYSKSSNYNNKKSNFKTVILLFQK